MSELAERLCRRFYSESPHPYRLFEERVAALLPQGGTLLDAGCGRSAPVLQKYRGQAGRLIGVDMVTFSCACADLELIEADLCQLPLADGSVDLVMSRSVFEHLTHPEGVYQEIHRVLKPGGRLIFLTANLWDYATVLARIIPNRFHPGIVARTEGRAEEDVFPTCYRSNDRRSIQRLARASGFDILDFRYLGQYPNYFMFNGGLFLLGTLYDKLVCRFDFLERLRGWILVTLHKR